MKKMNETRSFRQAEAFPLIAGCITRAPADAEGFADHATIVDVILVDPQLESRGDRWFASNMLQWFSQKITVGGNVWGDLFDREKRPSGWAYRSKTGVKRIHVAGWRSSSSWTSVAAAAKKATPEPVAIAEPKKREEGMSQEKVMFDREFFVQHGRRNGKQGGLKAAANMTPEERTARAVKAAAGRKWRPMLTEEEKERRRLAKRPPGRPRLTDEEKERRRRHREQSAREEPPPPSLSHGMARWESISGKHWAELYHDGEHAFYRGEGCGGNIGLVSWEAALVRMQMLVDSCYFLPDTARTGMRRVL